MKKVQTTRKLLDKKSHYNEQYKLHGSMEVLHRNSPGVSLRAQASLIAT